MSHQDLGILTLKRLLCSKGKCWDHSPIVQRPYGLGVAKTALHLATQTGLCLGPRFIVSSEGLGEGWSLYTYLLQDKVFPLPRIESATRPEPGLQA